MKITLTSSLRPSSLPLEKGLSFLEIHGVKIFTMVIGVMMHLNGMARNIREVFLSNSVMVCFTLALKMSFPVLSLPLLVTILHPGTKVTSSCLTIQPGRTVRIGIVDLSALGTKFLSLLMLTNMFGLVLTLTGTTVMVMVKTVQLSQTIHSSQNLAKQTKMPTRERTCSSTTSLKLHQAGRLVTCGSQRCT